MEIAQFLPQLGIALWNLKVMYDQHVENGNEIKELLSFIQDYDHQILILQERFQEGSGNIIGIAAFKNLEKDVMEATNKLERWSKNKSFFRLFNSIERMQKLGKLHSKVMASVQKSFGIVNLSMLLDLQAIQANISESNAELKSLLITSIKSMHGTLPTKVRDEVVEASTSSFGDPKFWEDVLAAVDNHNAQVSLLSSEKNVYEDPITANLMIDPIVASDGNTYCRWTIIDNNLIKNPLNMDEDLRIVIDNLNLRRGLFEMFPEQAQIFRQRRNEYRSHALTMKAQEMLGDAVFALQYVLQWDKHDTECIEALEQVQVALLKAKEKYLQSSQGFSNELDNGRPSGSSIHEMLIGPSIDLNEAYKIFPNLSSSILKVRQQAVYGVSQWSARDVKFQGYIIKKGGIPLLATLLPSVDQITQEYIISILLDISQSSYKHRTIFGTIKLHFTDVLEHIAEVLFTGPTKVREQVARIFFNLSTSFERRGVIKNSRVMHTLVTTLGDKTLQVQHIAICTVNNLFPAALVPIAEILKMGSSKAREQAIRLLYNLSMCPDWRIVIGKSVATLALVTSHGYGTLQVQKIVIDTFNNLFPDALGAIAKVLKKDSPKAREQAARILFNLSTSPDRIDIIGKSVAMHALVTSLGNGTLLVQQIVSSTLFNLLSLSMSNERRAINVGLVPILLRLIVEQPRTMLEEALALVHQLVYFHYPFYIDNSKYRYGKSYHTLISPIIPMAHSKIWLDIMASESIPNQERAASILYCLCLYDRKYSRQARDFQAHEKISCNPNLSLETKLGFDQVLDSNFSIMLSPTTTIPFPKKDWWLP